MVNYIRESLERRERAQCGAKKGWNTQMLSKKGPTGNEIP